jgi:hypothetical protein
MSVIEVSDHNTQTLGSRRASAISSLAAAGLFLGSAVLQLTASLQRWVLFRASSGQYVPEDHLYDYSFPYGPWENIGTSAQLFGAGTLLLALGVLAMAIGVITLPSATAHRGVAVILGTAEIVIAVLVAGSFAISGAHALVSGVTGAPSPLHQYGAMGWLALFGLILLIVRWGFKSPAAMMACVFLIGSTWLGHFIAAFQIAPILAGYVSHDTTPWTETVMAVWTAVAGVSMIFAAGQAARFRAPNAA